MISPVVARRRSPKQTQRVVADITKAQALFEAGDFDAAEPLIRRVLKHGYADPVTYDALGTIARCQGKPDLAIALYRKAIAIDPDYVEARDWIIMTQDVQPETTAAQAQQARASWWQHHGAPLYARRLPHENTRDPARPIRVGYVSGDFNFHSASNIFHRIVLRHSESIDPVFYSSLPYKAYDAITNSYRVMPGWRDVVGLTDTMLADKIRDDRIDILVDLSGYTHRNRLRTFACAPAPILVSAWGYATGLGWPIPEMHLFSDPVVIPPDRQHEHAERIIYLPCVIDYEASNDWPVAGPLSDGPPTFGAFHRSMKFNDEILRVWVALLERVPDSRLIIKGDFNDAFKEHLRRQMRAVADRVEFQGATTHDVHMRAYQQVDLLLDTWPQTAGVTACESLWMGVPPVTLIGPRVIQRTTASLLTCLGLEPFITTTPEHYIAIAAEMVTDRRAILSRIRQRLRSDFKASPIMAGYLEAVEARYRELFSEWCATPVSLADARKRLELVCA